MSSTDAQTQDLNTILTFPTSKMISDIRTATITAKGQIVLPKEARKKAGFKEGTKVAIITHKDRVELRPLPQFSEAMEAMLLSEPSFMKEWDTPEEDEAWKDL